MDREELAERIRFLNGCSPKERQAYFNKYEVVINE